VASAVRLKLCPFKAAELHARYFARWPAAILGEETQSGLFQDCREVLRHLPPVLYADEAGCRLIVRGGVEDSLAFEADQVAGHVVNEVVGAEDAFVAAENIVRGRNERKMALQPAVFWAERVGDGHGLGGDEDFEAGAEVSEDLLRVGHDGQVFKKIFGIEKGAQLDLALLRCDLPKAFAGKIVRGNFFFERLVVTAKVLGQRIGHYLIHVYADALHAGR